MVTKESIACSSTFLSTSQACFGRPLLFCLILLLAAVPLACQCDGGGDSGGGDDDAIDDNTSDDDTVDDDTTDDDTVDDDTSETTWIDENTDLTWQNGPDIGEPFLTYEEGGAYCEDLEWGGYDDWRLPTISELRSLIRDCAGTVTGGECGITDECLDADECRNDACSGCAYLGGPGYGGAYWPAELFGLPDRYISSSMVPGPIPDHAWYIHFGSAEVYWNGLSDHASVRCVR